MKIEVLFSESPASVKLHFTKAEKKHFGDVASMCESIAKYMRPSNPTLADAANVSADKLTEVIDICMDGVTESEDASE